MGSRATTDDWLAGIGRGLTQGVRAYTVQKELTTRREDRRAAADALEAYRERQLGVALSSLRQRQQEASDLQSRHEDNLKQRELDRAIRQLSAMQDAAPKFPKDTAGDRAYNKFEELGRQIPAEIKGADRIRQMQELARMEGQFGTVELPKFENSEFFDPTVDTQTRSGRSKRAANRQMFMQSPEYREGLRQQSGNAAAQQALERYLNESLRAYGQPRPVPTSLVPQQEPQQGGAPMPGGNGGDGGNPMQPQAGSRTAMMPPANPEVMMTSPQGPMAQPIDHEAAGYFGKNFNVVMGFVPATMDEWVRAWAWFQDNTQIANMPEAAKMFVNGLGGPPQLA